MKRFVLIFFILILGMPTSNTHAAGQVFYVDKHHASASDQNTGSFEMPWLTIGYATGTATAGDTVYVRAGTYYESVVLQNEGNGTEGPIFICGYPGEIPVIDGTAVGDANNGVLIDQSYIELRHFEIRNWDGNGIWITDAGFVKISDCSVHNVTYGIGISDGAHDFTFNRVEVHHFDLYGFDVTSSDQSVSYNGTWNDCVTHDGRDPEQNVDGFALGHGNQHDFVFNRCTTYNVFDGFDISSRQTTLNRCMAHDCWNGCYKLWQDDVQLVNCIGHHADVAVVELDWDGDPGVTTMTNCTFYAGEVFTVWIENALDSLVMVNCILAGGENIGLAFEQMGTDGYRGNYNLFHNRNSYRSITVGYTDEFTLDQVSLGAWMSYSEQDSHSLAVSSESQIFLNLAPFDGHLPMSSPAVDRGSAESAPSEDYEGNPRPSGSGFDIGAYEYQHETGIKNRGLLDNPSGAVHLYPNFPNPFNTNTIISYNLKDPGFVEITIYNNHGRVVRNLSREYRQAGKGMVCWDARDDRGQNVPSGVYHYVIDANGGGNSGKIILLQ